MNIGMQGHFVVHKQKVKMENGEILLDSNGEQIPIGDSVKVAEFDNLITNGGLNRLGIGQPIELMYLSTDTKGPTVTDTTENFIGWSTTVPKRGFGDCHLTGDAPYYITHFSTYRFVAGKATGNITKIITGWGSVDSIAGIWSTALVKDSLGLNTSITKLPDEILDVTYQVKKYITIDDYVGIHPISGIDYNFILRVAKLQVNWLGGSGKLLPLPFFNIFETSDKELGTIFTTVGNSSITTNKGTLVQKPYVLDSFQRAYSMSFDVNNANHLTGIRSVKLEYSEYGEVSFSYQIRLGKTTNDEALIKTKNESLTLPDIVISWGRYEPT